MSPRPARDAGARPFRATLWCLALLASCGDPRPVARPHPRRPAVTLAAAGDVLFAREIARQIRAHGPDHPFRHTKHLLRRADIAFCNLEGTLSRRGEPARAPWTFRGDPAWAGSLARAGFDVVSLANNHILDYGPDALWDTIRAIEKHGMVAVGAGRTPAEARRLRLVERRDLKVGFLAFTDIRNAGRSLGRAAVAVLDERRLGEEVRAARSRCHVLVVSFHWGIQYMLEPTFRQERLARLAVNNGADLVLGHHPHVLQKIATYREKPIAYSLGAFVWDARIRGSDRSALLFFALDHQLARLIQTIRIQIQNGQPCPNRSGEKLH